MKFESRYGVGDRTYFQPVLSKIDAREQSSDESSIPCKIMAVGFHLGKVLYDIALPNGEGGFYEIYPLRCVDSFFIVTMNEAEER